MMTKEFNTAFVENRQWIFACAMTYVGNVQDANDLVQDAYLKAYAHHNDKVCDFKKWVYTIMKNIFLDGLRHKACIDFTDDIELYDSIDCDDVSIDYELRLREIDEAMDGIRDEYKRSLMMYAKGYTYDEIARTLNRPISTVSSDISRARKRINKHQQYTTV